MTAPLHVDSFSASADTHLPKPEHDGGPPPSSSRTGHASSADVGVWSRLSLHEFLVDFFGSLVPGLLFVGAIGASVIPAAITASAALHFEPLRELSLWRLVLDFLKEAKGTPNTIWIALLSFLVMMGYVVGHLFYRRDPKIPDRRSFDRLCNEELRSARRAARARAEDDVDAAKRKVSKVWRLLLERQSGRALAGLSRARRRLREARSQRRSAIASTKLDESWLRNNLACANHDECQFPYRHMDAYLRHRGHDHLADIARNWCGNSRSKIYLNGLKLRLAFYHPEKYRPIVRNEAHVRLVTSTWYMAQALWKISIITLVATLAAAGVHAWLAGRDLSWLSVGFALRWSIDAIMPVLLVIGGALYSRRACESFLHYQRLREVFTVLELAYTAEHLPAILDTPNVAVAMTGYAPRP